MALSTYGWDVHPKDLSGVCYLAAKRAERERARIRRRERLAFIVGALSLLACAAVLL